MGRIYTYTLIIKWYSYLRSKKEKEKKEAAQQWRPHIKVQQLSASFIPKYQTTGHVDHTEKKHDLLSSLTMLITSYSSIWWLKMTRVRFSQYPQFYGLKNESVTNLVLSKR